MNRGKSGSCTTTITTILYYYYYYYPVLLLLLLLLLIVNNSLSGARFKFSCNAGRSNQGLVQHTVLHV